MRDNPDERSLRAALERQLKAILEDIPWLQRWDQHGQGATLNQEWDFTFRIDLPRGDSAELLVVCKADPRPSLFSTIVERRVDPHGMTYSSIPLLGAPYISTRMAEVCWSRNWGWFDLAGNCRINFPNGFYIERTGRPRLGKAPRPSVNLSRWESGRIVRVLLAPESAGMSWTQRQLVEFMDTQPGELPGASIGLVNKVVKYLRDEQYIEEGPRGGFKLRDPIGLLTAWRKAYRFDRHRRQGYFTLLQGDRLHQALKRLASRTERKAAYAVFSAAALQAPNVRQPKTWLYLRPEFEGLFAEAVDAKPVDSGENLVVLFPADNHVFFQSDDEREGLACTNPVQTCIDLYSAGGRGEEAAQAVLEQKLKPAWHKAGLL